MRKYLLYKHDLCCAICISNQLFAIIGHILMWWTVRCFKSTGVHYLLHMYTNKVSPWFRLLLMTKISFPLTWQDTEPPSVRCPDDITVSSEINQQCTEVSWVIPFVEDNSGGNVDVVSDPISGSCFSESTTVVTVTATDPFNNMNTCSFVVRVDTTSKLFRNC